MNKEDLEKSKGEVVKTSLKEVKEFINSHSIGELTHMDEEVQSDINALAESMQTVCTQFGPHALCADVGLVVALSMHGQLVTMAGCGSKYAMKTAIQGILDENKEIMEEEHKSTIGQYCEIVEKECTPKEILETVQRHPELSEVVETMKKDEAYMANLHKRAEEGDEKALLILSVMEQSVINQQKDEEKNSD